MIWLGYLDVIMMGDGLEDLWEDKQREMSPQIIEGDGMVMCLWWCGNDVSDIGTQNNHMHVFEEDLTHGDAYEIWFYFWY